MCLLLDLERVASGRGAVPRVEAVERARAERGELVDLLLLACVVFLWWSRGARFEVASDWRVRCLDGSGQASRAVAGPSAQSGTGRRPVPHGSRVTIHDAGARDETCAAPTSREAREASTAMTS